jgi:RHS repeat-associated protein
VNGDNLDWYDYGARMYDAQLGRWHCVDPLAERRIEWSSYAYVLNNPIFRFDPNGLTDYTINRKTGEVTQVGEVNDEPDRVLKTNRKGEIKYNKKSGKAKVAMDDIEKGILSDGMNFQTESNLFEVGGDGQPSASGVESFALKLSEYVGKEIGGAYFSKDGAEKTTHISIGMYKNNSFDETKSHGHNLASYFKTREEKKSNIPRFNLTGFFHTHPSANISNSDRLVPSDADLDARDNALRFNPNLKFLILTAPVSYGDNYPKRVPYTTGYSRRLK